MTKTERIHTEYNQKIEPFLLPWSSWSFWGLVVASWCLVVSRLVAKTFYTPRGRVQYACAPWVPLDRCDHMPGACERPAVTRPCAPLAAESRCARIGGLRVKLVTAAKAHEAIRAPRMKIPLLRSGGWRIGVRLV